MSESFAFYTERSLVRLTGISVSTLGGLLEQIRRVSGASIFYHTHDLYLARHFERPVYYNEFASWVSRSVQDRILAERLAAIDLLEFTSIRELREALAAAIADRLRATGTASRACLPGEEFHFCESQSFIMPTGIVAHDAPDFFEQIRWISRASLYFHFFEARLRLGKPTNDFSTWLADLGERRLAARIDALNPYVLTLDELKQKIVALGRTVRGRNRRARVAL